MRRIAPELSSAARPIAVIGLSCRLPGAPDPDSFWNALINARSAVSEAPADRWRRDEPLAEDIRFGGFLDGIDLFDADFFTISPREAAATDPQQRLLLELGWEALEHAGLLPAALAGTPTGVFVGAILDDYAALTDRLGTAGIDRHTLTGTQRGIIANRLSYVLGLRGPSLVVDSGQSSSLVAVHLACESLRRGESAIALAGGVNLNLLADSTLRVLRFGGLSPDGRCHTFDDRANGYVRGEGGGLVVLKPLDDALADGDRIRCVILGSAVNNDGASEGLTVPSAAAQGEAVRAACRQARVSPADLQYVELHGTGTRVGDPIEAAALGEAVGAVRPAGDPLLVGSAKTNVGHLEGAAGIVGLLKTALSLEHRLLPASLNHERPNPDIPTEALNLAVVRETRPWPDPRRRLLAGVSSFGVGGTNCHVVLAAPEALLDAEASVDADGSDGAPDPAPVVWLLSGRSPAALGGQARRLLVFAQHRPELDPAAVGHALATTRTAFPDRAAVIGTDRATRHAALAALAEGRTASGLLTGTATGGTVALLFPGRGVGWRGIFAEPVLDHLTATEPVFAGRLADCADALAPHTDWSLMDLLRAGTAADPALLAREDVARSTLFALTTALAELWRRAGVRPDAVLGTGDGEPAAAHAAGALTLDEAARLAARPRPVPGAGPDAGPTAGPTAAYWRHGVPSRGPLDKAVDTLLADGHTVLLELGPLERAATGTGRRAFTGSALRPGPADPAGFRTALAEAHLHGAPVDWAAVLGSAPARRIDLPTYAFQRERHWLDEAPPARPAPAPARPAPAPATEEPAPTAAPEGPRRVRELVTAHAATVLGRAAADLPTGVPFRDLGFDSLGLEELLELLGVDLDLDLPTVLVYDHPTPEALAEHLDTLLADPAEAAPTLLDRIDALGPDLAAETDGATRGAAAARLRALLRQIDPPEATNDGLAQAILSATTEEILDLIDNRGQQ
ncbi:beta-ketoacyl synthase N-terminal-like domain-containing protein [Kitasatospora sp. NPDC028055]|uniref:type I polyketide synthase n=1 Tax=Kitasatospora sp. NPDC028055 TaxID=3155653 RepID=UPI0033D0F315